MPGNGAQVAKLITALKTEGDVPEELMGNPNTLVSFVKACFKQALVGPLLSMGDEQLLHAALVEHKASEEAQVS